MTGPSKAELSAMVEEATIDCHDEEEQLTGFARMVQEYLEVPFTTTVLGMAIHVLDLPLPEPPPKGAEWIAAYRHWAR